MINRYIIVEIPNISKMYKDKDRFWKTTLKLVYENAEIEWVIFKE